LGSNKRLFRKPFPTPQNKHIIVWLEEFFYATCLDLKMGYHTIRSDQDASKICPIILPWGKYTPTSVNDGNRRFSRYIIGKNVGTNGIPRGSMSSP
jgi:hypothetical protein